MSWIVASVLFLPPPPSTDRRGSRAAAGGIVQADALDGSLWERWLDLFTSGLGARETSLSQSRAGDQSAASFAPLRMRSSARAS